MNFNQWDSKLWEILFFFCDGIQIASKIQKAKKDFEGEGEISKGEIRIGRGGRRDGEGEREKGRRRAKEGPDIQLVKKFCFSTHFVELKNNRGLFAFKINLEPFKVITWSLRFTSQGSHHAFENGNKRNTRQEKFGLGFEASSGFT